MTIDEFLERLAAVDLEWRKLFYTGAIRAYDIEGNSQCPISAVVGFGFRDAVRVGVERLGLSLDDANAIVYAADHCNYGDLRTRLLKACRL